MVGMFISGRVSCLFFYKKKLFWFYSTCLNGRSANNLGSWRCVKRSITPSVAVLFVIQVTDFCLERWQKKKKKRLLEHKRQENLLDFCSSHCLCPQNSCATTPAQHFGWSSVIVSDFGTCTGESRKPGTQLLWARPLKAGDCPVSHHHPWELSGAEAATFHEHEKFLLSPYPEDDHCMWRKAAKTKKENWRTLQSEICDLFHVSLSLEYNPFTVCFHQLHVTAYRTRQNTLTQSSKNRSCPNGVKHWMCWHKGRCFL